MISSSPLIGGPNWQSFAQTTPSSNTNASSQSNTLAIPQPSSSPSPPGIRAWGSNSLGGEALTVQSSDANRRTGGISDPIGSRPGSRTDSGSPSPLGSANTQQKRASQRPSASAAMAVAAAASSAAARSRAASPANFGSSDGSTFMGIGSSFPVGASHQQMGRSSSPSYMTARSGTGPFYGSGPRMPFDINDNKDFFSDGQGVSTPTLVVEEPDSTRKSQNEAEGFEKFAKGERSFTPAGVSASHASSGDEQADHAAGLPRRVAPQPMRTETMNSSSSSFGLGGGPSFMTNLPAASASSSSLNQHATLLSPSAAAAQNGAFSLPSPTANNGLPFFAGQGAYNRGGASSPTVSMNGMQPFASFADRSAVASPGIDVYQPIGNGVGLGMGTSSHLDFDAQFAASRTGQDLAERLTRMESNVRDLNRSVAGLNRNVSILLDRTKHLAGPTSSSQQQQQRGANLANNSASSPYGVPPMEEIRALSAQVSLLTNSMSQMMGQPHAGNGNGAGSGTPGLPGTVNTPLAGLGLGGAIPHLGNGSAVTTPQLGTFPGTPAYVNGSRFGAMANAGAVNTNSQVASLSAESGLRMSTPTLMNQSQMDRHSRLSPRPGASPGPQSTRRWSSMTPSTSDGNQQQHNSQTPLGAMVPPDPSVIVTKWEHLNLHPDLLRSILKYGLGPPNKIQQRALPFLLRGSDIIAQAPPTQERIASYVIPVLQLVLNISRGEAILPPNMGVRGPIALFISTTVDQATQAQRMAMGLGAALGIRVHITVASSMDVAQEASALIQTQPQIVVGTPQKMMDLFNFLANNTKGAISLSDVRCVVLDEVDQLIARNLADHVSTLLRILPTPRIVQYSNPAAAAAQKNGFNPLSPGLPNTAFGGAGAGSNNGGLADANGVKVTSTDRQTAIFSNTVPQDVLNFAQSIHLRESVRVLVRREGGAAGGTSSGLGGSTLTSSSQQTGSSSFQGANSVAPNSNNGNTSVTNSSNTVGLTPGAGPGSTLSLSQQPINTLGASPANNHANPMSDPILSSLRGLRQYYLYVAVTTGGRSHSPNPAGVSSQIAHAMEMKLDVITDLLEDIDFGHAVVYTSTSAAHEAVTYKLASKGIEALGLHRDMASTTRQQVLAKYRSSSTISGTNYHAAGQSIVGGTSGAHGDVAAEAALHGSNTPSTKKALVVHDVTVLPKDIHQVPLIVFYDLPRTVDDYKEKIACAASGGPNSRPSVCVNVVTGSGGPRGDIEMLRTLECHLGCKMAELPMNPSSILQF